MCVEAVCCINLCNGLRRESRASHRCRVPSSTNAPGLGATQVRTTEQKGWLATVARAAVSITLPRRPDTLTNYTPAPVRAEVLLRSASPGTTPENKTDPQCLQPSPGRPGVSRRLYTRPALPPKRVVRQHTRRPAAHTITGCH